MKRVFLLVVAIFLFSDTAWATDYTYYVDTTCSDGSAYDPSTPACTGGANNVVNQISDINALNINNNDTLTVSFRKGQTFNDATLTFSGITTPSSPGSKSVTVTAHGTGTLPWIGGGTTQPILVNYGVSGNGSTNPGISFSFNNIRVDGQNWGAVGSYKPVMYILRAHDVTLNNVNFDGSQGTYSVPHSGIQITGSTGAVEVSNGVIKYCGDEALWNSPVASPGGLSTDYNGLHINLQQQGSVTVHDMEIFNCEADCFAMERVEPTTRTLIYANNFYNGGENSIDLKGSKHVDVYYNWLHRTTDTFTGEGGSTQDGRHPIWNNVDQSATSYGGLSYNGAHQDNRYFQNIIGPTDKVLVTFGGTFGTGTNNIQVYQNWMKTGQYFFRLGSAYVDDIQIHHNVMTDLLDSGSLLYINHYVSGKFAWNSFYDPSWSGSRLLDLQYVDQTTGWDVSANTFQINDSDAYYVYNDYGTLKATLPNVWYNPANSGVRWRKAQANYSSLATWNAASGVGTDIEADPKFTTPASDDLTLQSNSPARDAVNIGSFTLVDNEQLYALDPASVWTFGSFSVNGDKVQANEGTAAEAGAYIYLDSVVATGSIITGLGGSNITETQIISGLDEESNPITIILTISGTTWDADIGSDSAETTALIAGLDSAQSEAGGWNNTIRDVIDYTAASRDSDTQVTITIPATAAYEITANETITVTIPASCTAAAEEIVATPNLTVSNVDPPPDPPTDPVTPTGGMNYSATGTFTVTFSGTGTLNIIIGSP
uniref:Uncharacterized protein n=1 Tax=viral metagenome TaxID=1070528 RepID=A0A6M3KIU1_9ZZZZ